MVAYKEERKKAIEYMAGSKSRVAITTDMWTSDNQRRGYMAITAHFIDDSWTLRNIIMRYLAAVLDLACTFKFVQEQAQFFTFLN